MSLPQISQMDKVMMVGSRLKTISPTLFLIIGFILLAVVILLHNKVLASACTAKGGEAIYSVDTATTSSYRLWLRVQASSGNNALYADIDGQQCLLMGDSNTISSTNWTWIDYTNGNSSQKANINLTKGSHTIKIIGHESGVRLDKVILTSDLSCVPDNFGDNCTNTTTPPSKTGDLNNDTKVDVFDLSMLLSRWQQQTANEPADINNDGAVNVFDLSILLSKWGM